MLRFVIEGEAIHRQMATMTGKYTCSTGLPDGRRALLVIDSVAQSSTCLVCFSKTMNNMLNLKET